MTENGPTPNPLANEMNIFKEEVLQKIKEIETKLTSEITNKELALNADYQNFTSQINLLMNNNKEMISTIVSQKLKLEKVSELESFKNKVDSMLITHEIRIKNNTDEIGKIKTKYDKIIADNLYVSGYIGNSCQFRNLSEYLNFNIADITRLRIEKDQLKKDIKELKNRFDGIMKTIVTMNDNTVKLCNNYTETKQEYFKISLDNAIKEINQKNMDIRVIIQKFQNDSDQKVLEIREEVNKLIKSESDLTNLVNDNFYICERQHEEINKNISLETEETSKHKKLFDNVDEKIQDIQNKLKILDLLNSRVRRMYDMMDNNTRLEMNKNSKNLPLHQSISPSPPPQRRMKSKNSNPELVKLNSDNGNLNNTNSKFSNIENNVKTNLPKKQLLLKSVRKGQVNNLNLNYLNSMPSLDESYRNKDNNKSKEIKENKEIKEIKEIKENKDTEEKLQTAKNNTIDNNNETNKNKIKLKLIINDEMKEKEDIETPRLVKTNTENSIQTLPIITLNEKKNNQKQVKFVETEVAKNSNINENRYSNNILTVISNESQTKINTNSALSQIKKIGQELEQEAQGCKVVSLNLSPGSAKGDKKNRRPPKPKYDIVNSLINDYRAKLFAKAHSPDAMNEINNEIIEMPKKVSQAFGRTTYTFYFQKDLMNAAYANKNVNNFGYNGPKKGYSFQANIKPRENNNLNNNINGNNNKIKK